MSMSLLAGRTVYMSHDITKPSEISDKPTQSKRLSEYYIYI